MSSISRLAALRARIELPLVRGASGLLEGRHRSIFSGHGQDFDELVEYRPGDDPKDIDWKTSARAGHPVIKRFQKETNLSMVLATYCPNVLFPYARQIVSDLVLNGGFPPLLLQPINFDALYAEQQRQQQGQGDARPALNA